MTIENKIEKIDDALLGKEGLYVSFAEQREVTKQQGENIDKLISGIEVVNNALIRTDAESKLIARLAKERKADRQWIIGLVIALVIAVLSATISTVETFARNKIKPKTEQTMD